MNTDYESIINKNKEEINNLEEVFTKEKTELDNKLKKCNDDKKKLLHSNNKLNMKNIKVTQDLEELDLLKEQQCNELLTTEKLKHEEYKESVNSLAGGHSTNNSIFSTIQNSMNYIETNLKESYINEKKKLDSYKKILTGGGKLQSGGNPILFMSVAVMKIALILLGTFIFKWWPIMMFVSLYCVYIEYKMIVLSGQNIMGLPILFLLGAYLCPCFWALARLSVGFTINENASSNLFNVFSKCTEDGVTLNFYEYYGRDCKDNKCLWTTNTCYETLFNKNNDDNMMTNLFSSAK